MLYQIPYIRPFNLTILFLILTLNSITLHTQNLNIEKFQYLAPVPSSKLNSSETNIIIKFDEAFDNSILSNSSLLRVIGSKSGQHTGKIILAEDDRTIIFYPDEKFTDGEVVLVELTENLKTASNDQIPILRYSFEISSIDINKLIKSDPKKYFKLLHPDFSYEKKTSRLKKDSQILKRENFTIQQDSLPEDFPVANVDSINNPTPGNIFYTPFIFPGFLPTYLIISDNIGIPVFYRKMKSSTFDFKKLINGNLTYYDLEKYKYYLLDSSYTIIDSMYMQNGYLTDMHDFELLDNNHSLLMCYDHQRIAMDSVVPGGNPNAEVVGIVIQELDENKNVVFQWRSWDHFQITDATYDINLTSDYVDYAHSNSIEVDYDGNILLSSRHFDEVTKISRQTGEIIWRCGGKHCENNEFTFVNDPIGFSHQHDVRRLPNGNITLFDNGNLHSPQFSRVAEYQIDEVNKFAVLIWEYRNDPETYSVAMGNVSRSRDHNTFIGWGTGTEPAMSEVRADGIITFYLSHPDTVFNYRAFKSPWKTNLFISNPDSLSFGYVPVGDSLLKSLVIKNNSDQEIEINRILNRDSAFYVNTSLPITIPASDTATIKVTFKPETDKDYFDDLHLQWNKENERIAQVVPLFGTTDSTFILTYVEVESNELDYLLSQNYPNPFNPKTTIGYSIPHESYVTIMVYDILGNKIKTLVNETKQAGFYNINFDGSELSSGIYIYTISADDFHFARKFILLK